MYITKKSLWKLNTTQKICQTLPLMGNMIPYMFNECQYKTRQLSKGFYNISVFTQITIQMYKINTSIYISMG